MPYKFETNNTPLPREHDRRVKLTDAQRLEIRESALSSRKAAAFYGVSRRLIMFIRDPERLADNYRRRVERGGSMIYYDREKHRQAMQRHRLHKKSVLSDTQSLTSTHHHENHT